MTAHTAENLFSTWALDRSSGVLLHVQIERLLRDLISRPPYSSGALLPDELTMASRLGVSRGTVRESILNLVHQGFLERRKGVGTRAVQTGLVDWASLTGEMRIAVWLVKIFVRNCPAERGQETFLCLTVSLGNQKTNRWR
jgi:DNA-binding GntR family transcriptional regulator